MTPMLTALLCLGLSLAQRTSAQEGASKKPSLLAQPSPVVTWGKNMTLQCRSKTNYVRFFLSKVGGDNVTKDLEQQDGPYQADFPLVRVNRSHGGRYRCYGELKDSSQWSAPSEPVDVFIAGELPSSPILSALPGPSVYVGEKVTFRCRSENQFDIFLLYKEGGADPPLRSESQHQDDLYLGNFTMNSVTSADGGIYRCYSSRNSTPYLMSESSAFLKLVVSALGLLGVRGEGDVRGLRQKEGPRLLS